MMSTPPPDSTRAHEQQQQGSEDPSSPSTSISSAAPPATASATPTNMAAANFQPPRLNPIATSEAPTTAGMTVSSTPLGSVNAARRPQPQPTFSSRSGVNAPLDIQERLKNFRLGRQGAPPALSRSQTPTAGQLPTTGTGSVVAAPPGMGVGGVPANFKLPNGMGKPPVAHASSSPEVPHAAGAGAKLSLAEKRGLKLPGGLPGGAASPAPAATGPA
ncbi:MAG: hypothetical protein INR71_06715, partial [Terriglobus roseus]|nr:hypothetical protein [Terriglobus roseus]